jgi:hypothetical protein
MEALRTAMQPDRMQPVLQAAWAALQGLQASAAAGGQQHDAIVRWPCRLAHAAAAVAGIHSVHDQL